MLRKFADDFEAGKLVNLKGQPFEAESVILVAVAREIGAFPEVYGYSHIGSAIIELEAARLKLFEYFYTPGEA
jgi:hypothetical protein